MTALAGLRIVTTALNVPGPVAAARLRDLGGAVTKVEPPAGDPLATAAPAWYAALHAGVEIVRLDLKDAGRAPFDSLLDRADLLLTSSRPGALARLGLAPDVLRARFPRLSRVAIVGHAAPLQELPGHDLTYLAAAGVLALPGLPRTLAADLLGAERAAGAALALLLGRVRGQTPGYVEVALADAADLLAEPLRHGLTAPAGTIGGAFGGYNLYETRDGWLAVAALEPHFWRCLCHELALIDPPVEVLRGTFRQRSTSEWVAWGAARDLPIAAVRNAPERHDGVG